MGYVTQEKLGAAIRRIFGTAGCGDLERAVLREYEVAFDNGFEEVVIRRATDIFAAAEARPVKVDAIPKGGRLVRASFDLYFAGKKKARKVQIRLPNTLKLGRHCDARAVRRWLSKRGFRANAECEVESAECGRRGWTLKVGERVIAEGTCPPHCASSGLTTVSTVRLSKCSDFGRLTPSKLLHNLSKSSSNEGR
jgi:hypothetical protein